MPKRGGRLEGEPALSSPARRAEPATRRATGWERLRNPREGVQDLLFLLDWLDKKAQAWRLINCLESRYDVTNGGKHRLSGFFFPSQAS